MHVGLLALHKPTFYNSTACTMLFVWVQRFWVNLIKEKFSKWQNKQENVFQVIEQWLFRSTLPPNTKTYFWNIFLEYFYKFKHFSICHYIFLLKSFPRSLEHFFLKKGSEQFWKQNTMIDQNIPMITSPLSKKITEV